MNSVAFQGEPGAFSEEAAIKCCGRNVLLVPRRSFQDVVDAVLTGGAVQGILPVENSIIGQVAAASEAAATPGIEVVNELVMPIHHCLLALRGAQLADVRKVLSQPAALAQCVAFFESHPHMEAIDYYDTAGAAKQVAALKDPKVAAIASRRAGERYKLTVLADDIQDSADNTTRFVVVGRSRN